jgi:FKBP-type peptidyl-prolyl cis-trans isomerase SlyD
MTGSLAFVHDFPCNRAPLSDKDGPCMKIERNTVAIFHYTLRKASGDDLETSRDGEPSAYLHGANNILPGLERAMAGKAAGDVFTVELPPAEAYGERDPSRQQRIPVKHLLFQGKLRPGMLVQVNTQQGRRPATVIKAGKFSADLDTNHPLAGEDLVFDIEIVDVRPATREEMAHRHAHGPGGHHH